VVGQVLEEHLVGLKEQTKQLIDDIGIDLAVKRSGHSKAVVIRNYSTSPRDKDRFISIDDVAALESHASYPFVTSELAKMNGNRVNAHEVLNTDVEDSDLAINANKFDPQILAICDQFAQLVFEYQMAKADNVITKAEANILFSKTSKMEIALVTLKRTLVGILNKA
jgi:hypothetical protein